MYFILFYFINNILYMTLSFYIQFLLFINTIKNKKTKNKKNKKNNKAINNFNVYSSKTISIVNNNHR